MRHDVDVLVEVIGGTSGAGADAVMAALRAGKAVVTANKALVAERAAEVAALVAEHGTHADLIARDGVYARLVKHQANADGSRLRRGSKRLAR